MQYRTLGRTGVQVSTLALGAMNFGKIGRTTQDEVTAIVDAALEAGINLIDTADVYSGGESEEMVGKAIAGRRDDIVLATKATLRMGDERNRQGSSRRRLVTALENSLRRLGVDHVDLYQIHRRDPNTSDEETLPALTDLQRGIETHVLPVTEQYGLGVLVWSPLASGWLSGAIREGREITTSRSTFLPQRFDTTIPSNRARLDAVERLAGVADEAGLTMIQLALGFVTAHPGVTSALVGPRTLDHLHSQLAAADTKLSADVLDAIDAIVAPGADLAAHEKNDTPPSLLHPSLRRR
ncbi:aldo/keto reductase [Streptomyces mexicanus]|uniref:aldo/keto reductase n=1 Tax=Streptomyces mexicanus TaxID=178566 RepID=UPI00367AFE85